MSKYLYGSILAIKRVIFLAYYYFACYLHNRNIAVQTITIFSTSENNISRKQIYVKYT